MQSLPAACLPRTYPAKGTLHGPVWQPLDLKPGCTQLRCIGAVDIQYTWSLGFPGGSSGKELACQCRRNRCKFLGQEDPLEESMATHSSILAWRIPSTEENDRLCVHGVTKSWIRFSD